MAAKYAVSPAWVRRLERRRRETGEVAPGQQRRGPVPLSRTHGDALRQALADRPDATLEETRAGLGLAAAASTAWEALGRLGLTLKRK